MFLQGITQTLLDNRIRHQCTVSEEYVGITYAVLYFYLILTIAIINIMTIIVLYTLIGRRIVLHMRYRKRFHTLKKIQNIKRKNSKDLELRSFSVVEQSSALTSDGRYSTPVIRDESFAYRITKIAFAIGISFVISYVPSVVMSLTEATLGKDYTKNFGSTSIELVILAEKSFAINHVEEIGHQEKVQHIDSLIQARDRGHTTHDYPTQSGETPRARAARSPSPSQHLNWQDGGELNRDSGKTVGSIRINGTSPCLSMGIPETTGMRKHLDPGIAMQGAQAGKGRELS
ncbi:unnamed protein product [Mytilus coruscus]|uniref:G-protein coupled receptors family 1 profile domain-containing protein n=1 Tax=Mytilus coruscus TaxID=42192 RepID=A0A6J8DMI7_MYTCO|nr:unnamed protein product [Mytilus coruscus]